MSKEILQNIDLQKFPTEVINTVEIILKNDWVDVNFTESTDEKIVGKFLKLCTFKTNELPIHSISNYFVNKESKTNLPFSATLGNKDGKIGGPPKKCDSVECKYSECPFFAAAYIKYFSEKKKVNPEYIINGIKQKNIDFLKKTFIDRIEQLINNEDIKVQLKNLQKYLETYYKSEDKKSFRFDNYNFIFYGNGGVGKTAVIDLISEMFIEYNYSTKKYIEYSPGEIVVNSNERIEKAFKSCLDGIICFKNFDEFEKDGENVLRAIQSYANIYKNKITIILSGKKSGIERILKNRPRFREMLTFEYTFEDLNLEGMYQLLSNKCKNNGFDCTKFDKEKVIEFIDNYKKESNLINGHAVSSIYNKMIFNYSCRKSNGDKKLSMKDLPQLKSVQGRKKIEEIFHELNNLVGMDNVKKQLYDFATYLQYNSKLSKLGVKSKPLVLHMIFTGSPGTGKTTVARLVKDILYSLKYIEEDKLIEATSREFIGKYLGQTAHITYETIQKALGGVLFIDEAYSFTIGNKSGGNSYALEAITEIIKQMEDNKDKLIIIFAGYKKEMEDFIDLNPGIKSRIGYKINFEDFTSDELSKIFLKQINKYNYKITDGAINKVKEILLEATKIDNFGNARFCINLFERILLQHANNEKDTVSKRKLLTITENDINDDLLIEWTKKEVEEKKNKIGFI